MKVEMEYGDAVAILAREMRNAQKWFDLASRSTDEGRGKLLTDVFYQRQHWYGGMADLTAKLFGFTREQVDDDVMDFIDGEEG